MTFCFSSQLTLYFLALGKFYNFDKKTIMAQSYYRVSKFLLFLIYLIKYSRYFVTFLVLLILIMIKLLCKLFCKIIIINNTCQSNFWCQMLKLIREILV